MWKKRIEYYENQLNNPPWQRAVLHVHSMTHPGTLPRFLACSSLMICAFSTTGFPGAIFSPSRYRTVVENFDWVLMTCGGCLSTTRELKDTTATWERKHVFCFKRCMKVSHVCCSLWVKERGNFELNTFTFTVLQYKKEHKYIRRKTAWACYLWTRTCRSWPSLSWSSGIGSPISINSCRSLPFTPSSCSHLTQKICKENERVKVKAQTSTASKTQRFVYVIIHHVIHVIRRVSVLFQSLNQERLVA